MTLTRRDLGVVSGATLMAAGLVGAAAPAHAAACSGTNGVTVVIQTSASTSTHCVAGDPSSALSALQSVAAVTQVQTQPGFVCQINGYPNTSCTRTPPGSAYWAVFHAPAGGSWTYSQSGAATYNPKPGSSVGFRFGSGGAPSVRPAAPAPAPRPTTAAPRPTTAAPRPTTAAPKPTTARPKSTTAAPQPTTAAPRGTTTAPTPRPTSSGNLSEGAPMPTAAASASTATSGAASASATASALTPASPSVSLSASGSATSPASASATSDDASVSAQKPPSTGSGSSGRLIGGSVLLLALASAVGAVAVRRRTASLPHEAA